MDFGEVLAKAWRIIWKFKVLWIFGILAGCGTQGGGNFNFNSSYRTGGNGFSGPGPSLPPGVTDALNRFARLFENPRFVWEFLAGFIALICVIGLVEIALGTIGRLGLIKGAWEADQGAERLTFGALWGGSLPSFWRVFWMLILVGLPFFLIFLFIGVAFLLAFFPVLGHNAPGAGATLLVLLPVLCVLICVLALLSIVIGFILRMAECAVVIENQSILNGFRRGWEVLVNHLGPILIIWLITVAIGLAAGIVITLPLILVLFPIFIAFFSSGFSGDLSYTPLILAGVCVLAYIPVSLLFNGILMSYLQSVWTLTYLRLTRVKPVEGAPQVSPANA